MGWGPANVCNAPNAIGIATEKCAVIVSEKRKIQGKKGRKISQGMTALSRGVGCTINGSVKRVNKFVKPIVSEARDFYSWWRREPMFLDLAEITDEFSHYPRTKKNKLEFNLLAICCDPIHGPQLWQMEKDGTYASLGIASIGTHAEQVMYQTMNQNFEPWDHEEIILHLLKSLRAGLERNYLFNFFLEIGFVTTANPRFQRLDEFQVKPYVEKAFGPQPKVTKRVVENFYRRNDELYDYDDDSSDSEYDIKQEPLDSDNDIDI